MLSDLMEINSGLKEGDALSPILFSLILEKVVKATEEGKQLQLNRLNQVFAYVNNVCLIGEEMETVQKNAAIRESNAKDIGLAISVSKTKYMITPRNKSRSQKDRFRE